MSKVVKLTFKDDVYEALLLLAESDGNSLQDYIYNHLPIKNRTPHISAEDLLSIIKLRAPYNTPTFYKELLTGEELKLLPSEKEEVAPLIRQVYKQLRKDPEFEIIDYKQYKGFIRKKN